MEQRAPQHQNKCSSKSLEHSHTRAEVSTSTMESSTQQITTSAESHYHQSATTSQHGNDSRMSITTSSQVSHNDTRAVQALQTPNPAYILHEATTRLWRGESISQYASDIMNDLTQAWRKPPAETGTLATLDIKALLNKPEIRHDLNFERTVLTGPIAPQTAADWQYYVAVVFELVFRFAHAEGQLANQEGMNDILDTLNQGSRLNKFFSSIRKMSRGLIRYEHWIVVNDALDVDLLMSQLKKGTCDLLSLTVWLGGVLKQSCSPLRDSEVDRATATLVKSMGDKDGYGLAVGLSRLFYVFTTMKLDVANHQMRIILPPMIDESVEFVQRHLENEINTGIIDDQALWKWYHEKRMFAKAKSMNSAIEKQRGIEIDDGCDTFPDEDYLTVWTSIVLDMFRDNNDSEFSLAPFLLDRHRIEDIQREIFKIQEDQTYLTALSLVVDLCKKPTSTILSSPIEEESLLTRLHTLRYHFPRGSEALDQAISLEIVKTAYSLTDKPATTIPDEKHITLAYHLVRINTPAARCIHARVRKQIYQLIKPLLFDEINGRNGISHLLPSQILERYEPMYRPLLPTTGPSIHPQFQLLQLHAQVHSTSSSSSSSSANSDSESILTSKIEILAHRIAHITLIQWRVWAQLLWFKPAHEMLHSEEEVMEWQDEVSARICARFPALTREMSFYAVVSSLRGHFRMPC